MKKLFLVFAAASFMFAACNENLTPDEDVKVFGDGYGSIALTLKGDIGKVATKAADELAGHAYEKVLKETQIFIFNDKNNVADQASTPRAQEILYRYDNIESSQTTKTLPGIKANRTNGTNYRVVALANYKTCAPLATDANNSNGDLSGGTNGVKIKNRGELEAKAVELSMHDVNDNGAFPMFGIVEKSDSDRSENPVNVTANGGTDSQSTASATPANVSLRRFVSRIHLKSIKNEIPQAYGALRIHRVYILNGYGMWNIGANIENYDSVTGKYNWSQLEGDGAYQPQVMRKYGTPLPITNGGSQDFDQQSAINQFFYTMPNPTAKADDNFKGAITADQKACTRLVIEASFENDDRNTQTAAKIFYYPVTILGPNDAAMLRNTTYDVSCVIKNEGSDHPNDEPVYGALAVTVTVKDWDDGGQIEKNF